MLKRIAAVLLPFAVIAAVAVPIWITQWRKLHPGSLVAWVDRVERPGWRCVLSAESHGHWAAVFAAGRDEIAICDRVAEDRVAPGKAACMWESNFRMEDADGERLEDWDRSIEGVSREVSLGMTTYTIADGEIVPLRAAYVGPVHVIVHLLQTDPRDLGDHMLIDDNTLIDETIDWPPK
jgi:hypothetical protein